MKRELEKQPEKLEFMIKLRNKIPIDKKELFDSKIKWKHLK